MEDPSEDSSDGQDEPGSGSTRKFTRRKFVKWGVAAGVTAGLAGMGVLSAMGVVKTPAAAAPPWDFYATDPRTGQSVLRVDYDKVPYQQLAGPTPNVLNVAQWYDYWPGSFTADFENYIRQTYNLNIHVQVSIYESNEELFEWITLGRQQFDVFFPSNYVVDLMKHGNLVYNLQPDWMPNFQKNVNVPSSPFVGIPRGNPFDMNAWNEFTSVPYFWGTTGLGFRSDVIPRADVVANGIDLLWMPSFTTSTGKNLDLVKNMRMLDDERDVLGWGFKRAGWQEQLAKGLTPTGLPNDPNAPYNGVYQWTENEVDPSRVDACGRELFAARPNLFDFNSTEDATSLVAGASIVNQAWSGDIMYAKRPDQNQALPVDYVIPNQGSTWWIDCAAVHSKSRNLWLAHEFLDFIHRIDQPWQENQALTKWNLYSTPNLGCYDYLYRLEHSGMAPGQGGAPTPIYPSGWIMTDDPILYPNLDPAGTRFNLCDMSGDVGLTALLNEYNPLWFELTSV